MPKKHKYVFEMHDTRNGGYTSFEDVYAESETDAWLTFYCRIGKPLSDKIVRVLNVTKLNTLKDKANV